MRATVPCHPQPAGAVSIDERTVGLAAIATVVVIGAIFRADAATLAAVVVLGWILSFMPDAGHRIAHVTTKLVVTGVVSNVVAQVFPLPSTISALWTTGAVKMTASALLTWVLSNRLHPRHVAHSALVVASGMLLAIGVLAATFAARVDVDLLRAWQRPSTFDVLLRHRLTHYANIPIECPRALAKNSSAFFHLPEEDEITWFLSMEQPVRMLLVRGVSRSGKTTMMRQAICNVGAQLDAIFIGARMSQWKAVRSFDELSDMLEEALVHLPIELPQGCSGEDRFSKILQGIVKYEEAAQHRVVVFDDFHVLQGMSDADLSLALHFIKEMSIEIQYRLRAHVMFASSDDLFVGKLVGVMSLRIRHMFLHNVPLDECMKHDPGNGMLRHILTDTGAALTTCLGFQASPNISEAEQRIAKDAISKVNASPRACLPILVPQSSHWSGWSQLRSDNFAEQLELGVQKMLDIYNSRHVKEYCAAIFGRASEVPFGDELPFYWWLWRPTYWLRQRMRW